MNRRVSTHWPIYILPAESISPWNVFLFSSSFTMMLRLFCTDPIETPAQENATTVVDAVRVISFRLKICSRHPSWQNRFTGRPAWSQSSKEETWMIMPQRQARSMWAILAACTTIQSLAAAVIHHYSLHSMVSSWSDQKSQCRHVQVEWCINGTIGCWRPRANHRQVQLLYDLSNTNTFAGDTSANQSNSISGYITVEVIEVLANGNLVVRGEKVDDTVEHGRRVYPPKWHHPPWRYWFRKYHCFEPSLTREFSTQVLRSERYARAWFLARFFNVSL